jgi:tight adherence protein C
VSLPLLMSFLVSGSDAGPGQQGCGGSSRGGGGLPGPNEYMKAMTRRRQKQIRRGLPNALDLMVVCVESGLGLDQAVVQVAKDLDQAHPEISEEFTMVNLELKAGKRRTDALRNLAERTNVEDLKKLVAVLIQADRFGTGWRRACAARRLHARAGAADRRGEGGQAGRQAGVPDFLLYSCRRCSW